MKTFVNKAYEIYKIAEEIRQEDGSLDQVPINRLIESDPEQPVNIRIYMFHINQYSTNYIAKIIQRNMLFVSEPE